MLSNSSLRSVLAVLVCCAGVVSTHEHLKEPPSFLKACKLHSSTTNDNCTSKAVEGLFKYWKDGIPGIKGLGSIDPLRVKKVRFSQQTENVADIQAELRNMVAAGLSKLKVINAGVNEKDYTFQLELFLPALKIQADYKVKGRLLLLTLDSHGIMYNDMINLEYTMTAKTDLKKIDDEYFFNITSLDSDIKTIGGFKTKFTNLFNGNKELEDSANLLFNDNWRDIYSIMRPVATQLLNSITLGRFKTLFQYVPARFFFTDLP